MKKIILIPALAIMFIAASCSKSGKLSDRLVGTWKIDNLTSTKSGSAAVVYTNFGTFVMYSDKTCSLTSTMPPSTTPNTDYMTWSTSDKSIAFYMSAGNVAMILDITTNEKSKQVWTETDGNTTNVYTLSKQ